MFLGRYSAFNLGLKLLRLSAKTYFVCCSLANKMPATMHIFFIMLTIEILPYLPQKFIAVLHYALLPFSWINSKHLVSLKLSST